MARPQGLYGRYEIVIGLETHTQLSTASKIFSGSSTRFGAEPNTQASAVDLALPGTLPVLNRGAVERAIRLGLAVGGVIAPVSIFARKNYFYPALPKAYQISQYEIPVVQGGTLSFALEQNGTVETKTVRLTRAHLEEDAGKSLHEDYEGMSGIDLNRAGTPLLEIVSEPDMRSSAEAVAYAKTLHALVQWIGICDGNMQEGSFRCDANVSVRPPGQKEYGTRREIKNLNSFKFLQQAIEAEIRYQIETLEDGGRIEQATVLFDPDRLETRSMRSKEDAHDYRYFPDPDLPPLVIGPEWVESVRKEMPELPAAMRERFVREYGLSEYDAGVMTQSKAFATFFETAAKECSQPKLVANWLMGEVSKELNAEGKRIEEALFTPRHLSKLISRIVDGTVSSSAAKQIFEELWKNLKPVSPSGSVSATLEGVTWTAGAIFSGGSMTGDPVDSIIEVKGLKQISDSSALEKIIDEILAKNPAQAADYRSGKEKLSGFFVGQAMKATQGKANPQQLNELLKRKLSA